MELKIIEPSPDSNCWSAIVFENNQYRFGAMGATRVTALRKLKQEIKMRREVLTDTSKIETLDKVLADIERALT